VLDVCHPDPPGWRPIVGRCDCARDRSQLDRKSSDEPHLGPLLAERRVDCMGESMWLYFGIGILDLGASFLFNSRLTVISAGAQDYVSSEGQ
jgi:hypothetical protein